MPALWQTLATTTADRKEIIRALVERVVVQVRKDSEYVEATIYWQGSFTSSTNWCVRWDAMNAPRL